MKNAQKYQYILICLYLMFTVVACQSMSPSNESAGSPHVLLENTSSSIVMNTIISSMKNSGFSILSSNNSAVVVGRQAGRELAADVFGSSFSGPCEIRITYSILSVGRAVKVLADLSLVANPDTSSAKTANLNGTKYAQNMQASLETLKGAIQPIGHAAAQPQGTPTPSQQPSLQQPSLDDSQLAPHLSDIRSKGSVSAKIRAAADLYNAGKITREQRNVLQQAILKGEI